MYKTTNARKEISVFVALIFLSNYVEYINFTSINQLNH